MKKPKQELILEWTESEVTQYLLAQVRDEQESLEEVCRTSDVYAPFEPQKTQERIANFNGAIDTFDVVIETLEGRGLFDELEDEEGEV